MLRGYPQISNTVAPCSPRKRYSRINNNKYKKTKKNRCVFLNKPFTLSKLTKKKLKNNPESSVYMRKRNPLWIIRITPQQIPGKESRSRRKNGGKLRKKQPNRKKREKCIPGGLYVYVAASACAPERTYDICLPYTCTVLHKVSAFLQRCDDCRVRAECYVCGRRPCIRGHLCRRTAG